MPARDMRKTSKTIGNQSKGRSEMNNIFYIIGVVVVVLFILGYFGFR